ncbi:MAG: TonB-dependent receptor [Alphaproteobacteria bacterium]
MPHITKRFHRTALISSTAIFALFNGAQAQSSETQLQDLSTALISVANEANVEILFAPGIVQNKVAAVNPDLTEPKESLSSILTGTGLTFDEMSPNVFIIRANDSDASTLTSSSPERAVLYAQSSSQLETETAETQKSGPIFTGGTGVLEGQVVHQATGQPLAGAIVGIVGTTRTTATDIRGFYRFSAAPAGKYSVSVDYIGAPGSVQFVKVAEGEKSSLSFSLVDLDDNVITFANRSSLTQALNQQRTAPNSATVVAADLLGSFPAETISEALRRVPGVAFTRDDATGEGDRISIRGFSSDAINVQVNNVELNGTGTDRSVDLSGFLTDNIKQVVIQKSLLPSQEATGSGGLVEIETKSGLDYGKKYLSVGTEYEAGFESGFGDESQYNVTGAYQLTDDFGVSASVQYRDSSRENFDAANLQTISQVLPAGFTSSFLLPERFDYPFDPEVAGPLYSGGNYFFRERDETNLTASLNFAYDFKDHTRLRLDLQQIKVDAEFSTSRSTLGFLTSSTDMPIPQLNDEVRRRTYLRSLRPTLGIEDSAEELTNTTISFRGETDIDNYEFDYRVGYAKIRKDRLKNSVTFLADQNSAITTLIDPATIVTNPDDNAAMTQRVVGGAVVHQGDGIPILSLTDAGRAFISDPDNYYVSFASLADARDETESFSGELSARRYFASPILDYIEIGGEYKDVTRSNSDDVLSNTNLISSQSYARNRVGFTYQNTFINDLSAGALGAGDLSSVGVMTSNVPTLRAGTASEFIAGIQGLLVDDPNTAYNEHRFNLTDRTGNPIDISGAISPSEIKEERFAAYVQSQLEFGDLEVVGGVRYERDKKQSTSISSPSIILAQPGYNLEPRATFISAGLIDFFDSSNDQYTLTPSVIANYRPNESMVFRGAFFRSTINPSIAAVARPVTYALDLRPGRERGTIREPNPDLKATKTDNFDFDASYYFKDNPGLIRAGFFYKKLSNNFTSTLIADEATTDDLRQRLLDYFEPLNGIDPTLTALPLTAEYFIQRPRNGEGGDVFGVEMELIKQLDFFPEAWPEFLSNFSFLGNLTYTTSSFIDLESARDDNNNVITLELDRPFQNQSEWSGNASLEYVDGGFSGRVIYTFQSEYGENFDEFNLNTIVPSFDTLDLRLAYTIDANGRMPRMTFYVEGDDMLTSAKDADIRRGTGSAFGDGNIDFFYPTTLQFNGGRRFTVGARMTF